MNKKELGIYIYIYRFAKENVIIVILYHIQIKLN